jgi:glycosyltransferase involved in cell wall biosynthesis
MYCGSCLHDNTLAAALSRIGVDIQLIPVYTPLRTDERNVSIERVFFGGINVYLQQKFPLLRYVPPSLDRVLDHPRLIRWAMSRQAQTNPRQLGDLAVSMLRGTSGGQRKEVERLCRWLSHSVQPHLINLTNVLIAGCAPALKATLSAPLLVTLQGDDVFLDELAEPHRSRVLEEIRELIKHVDGFLVHSQYYADHMSDYLGIPREKLHQVKLGIETADFEASLDHSSAVSPDGRAASTRPPTVGYLARLAPEKGLHVLCKAMVLLRQRPETARARLRVAGWLGDRHRAYVQSAFQQLEDAGCGDELDYHGEVDRKGKIEFLKQIDVLSVPTIYREPKGLYVLEALAAGVPVVQPRHGAFPELIQSTGGGRLVRPDDPGELADVLAELLTDAALRQQLGQRGRQAVYEQFNAEAMARSTIEVYRRFLSPACSAAGGC